MDIVGRFYLADGTEVKVVTGVDDHGRFCVSAATDNSGGSISFSGASYRVGRSWSRRSVNFGIVGGSVQISEKDTVIRVGQIKHDRSKEHGAFATPNGRPRTKKSA